MKPRGKAYYSVARLDTCEELVDSLGPEYQERRDLIMNKKTFDKITDLIDHEIVMDLKLYYMYLKMTGRI